MIGNVVVDGFVRGGPMMWPILAALIGGCTVVLERGSWWLALQWTWADEEVDAVLAGLAKGEPTAEVAQRSADSPSADLRSADLRSADLRSADPRVAVIAAGLREGERSPIAAMQAAAGRLLEAGEQRQWVLGTLITLAPLLGLLGTITGIMGSFSVIGEEQLAATKVSGGIAEALIATACGLGIAILCLIPFNYFNRRIVQLRRSLERAINAAEVVLLKRADVGESRQGVVLKASSAAALVKEM